MHTLFKIINGFFVILGILFFIIIIGASYIWIADPLNLKEVLPSGISPISVIKSVTGNNKIEIDNVDKNPLLTEEQEAQLESIGIEPADLHSEITPEMEQCSYQKLGQERAEQIIQGSAPSPTDFLKASSCL